MKNRYEVSEEFKQSCKENVGLKRYGRIHVVEDDIDIVGENYDGQLVDFTIVDNCYTKDTFIGTTEAKKITVNILNPDNLINLENKSIEVYVGIEIDGKLEEIPYGTYIIEKPENEEVKQKTSFTGYDYMIKFNPIYQNRVEYPIKLSALLEDLCNQVGLELGSTDFTNADYMVLGNPFTNNEDCRTVLSNIAQLAGGFAKIGRDNKVYIRTLQSIPDLARVKDVHNMPVKDLHVLPVYMLSTYKEYSDESLNGNNYFEDFSKNEEWGKVNSLVLSISDIEGENTARTDEESIEKDGLTEITIADNYFLINEEERNKVIEPLWERLKGTHYLPFKTKYYGYPHLDSGDVIAVDDTKDFQYISYVFNHTFTFNGAFTGEIDTPAMTKTQTAYKNTQNIKSILRKAERKIDKINGVIEDIVEEQTETSQKLTQHEQTIEGFKRNVTEIEEKVTTVENKADEAQSTAEGINKNLVDNYYNKIQTDTKIEEKAGVITSEVSRTVSTAKEEAINQSNSDTDEKLKNYVVEEELGTKIEQNYEHIKYAWNKISEFIQLEIIDGTPVLAVRDEYKDLLMTLNKTGQDFYKNGKVFGKMGVESINYNGIDENYIAFSVKTNDNNEINDGMAWGFKDKKGNFCPVLFIKNFYAGSKDSDDMYGQLVLDSCDLVLNGINTGIIGGNIKMYSDIMRRCLVFEDTETGTELLRIKEPNSIFSGDDDIIHILDQISFFANAVGSNSIKVGNSDTDYCLMTSDGGLHAKTILLTGSGSEINVSGEFNFGSIPTYHGDKFVYGWGHKYYLNWTGSQLQFWVDTTNVGTLSDTRLKKEIKDIDEDFIKAIKEIEMKQFKVANRNGLITFGILAQDLIEIFKKYNKNPFDYEIVYETKYKEDDDTIYYGINYEQFLILKTKAQEQEIKELQEKDKKKDEIIQDLLERVQALEGGTK